MSDAVLEYSHSMDWSESQVDTMKSWLSTTWVAMEEDEPDQDFLEYIMVCDLVDQYEQFHLLTIFFFFVGDD